MKRILIDTNVILDIALERAPFVEQAQELIRLIEEREIKAFISATTVTDIYYVAKQKTSHEKVINFLENLFVFVSLLSVDGEIILRAMKSENRDFEDAVQIEVSKQNNISVIITRNKKDFIDSELQIYSPDEYITELKRK